MASVGPSLKGFKKSAVWLAIFLVLVPIFCSIDGCFGWPYEAFEALGPLPGRIPKGSITFDIMERSPGLVGPIEGIKFGRPGVYYEVYANLPQGAQPDPKSPNYIGNLPRVGDAVAASV